MYALLIVVLAPPELVQEFAAEGIPMLLALLALGNLSFWLCDQMCIRDSCQDPVCHVPGAYRGADNFAAPGRSALVLSLIHISMAITLGSFSGLVRLMVISSSP